MGKRAISNFSSEITLMCFLNLSVFLAINIKTGKNHGWFYIEIHLWDFRELKTLLEKTRKDLLLDVSGSS